MRASTASPSLSPGPRVGAEGGAVGLVVGRLENKGDRQPGGQFLESGGDGQSALGGFDHAGARYQGQRLPAADADRAHFDSRICARHKTPRNRSAQHLQIKRFNSQKRRRGAG